MTTETDLEQRWRVLGFDLALSAHYHQERRRFFENWHNRTLLLGVLFGSATVVGVVRDHPHFAIGVALLLTTAQALSLVLGFARKSWTHADLYRGFVGLQMQWNQTRTSSAALAELNNQRLKLEQSEPPAMPYLVRRCHAEVARREGYPESEQPHLPWWARLLAHYLPQQLAQPQTAQPIN